MRVKSAQAGESGWWKPTSLHYIYYHEQSCGEGSYTLPLFLLYPYVYSVLLPITLRGYPSPWMPIGPNIQDRIDLFYVVCTLTNYQWDKTETEGLSFMPHNISTQQRRLCLVNKKIAFSPVNRKSQQIRFLLIIKASLISSKCNLYQAYSGKKKTIFFRCMWNLWFFVWPYSLTWKYVNRIL